HTGPKTSTIYVIHWRVPACRDDKIVPDLTFAAHTLFKTMAQQVFSYQQLFDFSEAIFKQTGCSAAEAREAATVLLSADLRGIDSHGIARLSGYVRLWQAGRVNTRPDVRILHETPSTATVDGDSGLGLVVAPKAMQIAIDKARVAGSGWV